MENYGKAIEYADESLNSSGIAEKKYEIYLESIDAKVNQFIATWEKLVNNLNQSSTYKGLIELATIALELVDDFHLIEIAVYGAFGVGSIALVAKFIKTFKDSFGSIGSTLSIIQQYPNNINKIVISMQNLETAQQMMILNSNKFNDTTKKQIANLLGLDIANGKVVKATNTLTNAQRLQNFNALNLDETTKNMIANALQLEESNGELILSSQKATKATINQALANISLSDAQKEEIVQSLLGAKANNTLSTSFKGLTASIGAFAKTPMGILTIITMAIPLITKMVDWAVTTTDEAKEAFDNASQELQNTEQEIESLNSELEETNNKINELKGKGSLTIVEQKELETLQQTNQELELQIKMQEQLKSIQKETATEEAYAATHGITFETSTGFANSYDRLEKALKNYQLAKQGLDSTAQQLAEGKTKTSTGSDLQEIYNLSAENVAETGEELTTLISETQEYVDLLKNSANPEYRAWAESLQQVIDKALYANDAVGYLKNTTDKLATTLQSNELGQYSIAFQNQLNDSVKSITSDESILKDLQGSLSLSDEEINLAVNFNWEDTDKNSEEANKAIEKIQDNLKSIVIHTEIEEPDDAVTNDIVNSLKTIKETANSLDTAFSEISDNGFVSASTLAGLSETFGSVVDNYDSYVNVLKDTTSSQQEQEDALNGLLSEYIQAKGLLDNITESDKAYIIQQLKAIGVINAEEVASQALSQSISEQETKKTYLELTNGKLSQSTLNNINNFLKESDASDTAKISLINYTLAQIDANANQLNLSTSVAQLAQLASMAGIAAESLNFLITLTTNPSSIVSDRGNKLTDLMTPAELQNYQAGMLKYKIEEFQNNLKDKINNSLEFDWETNYNPDSSIDAKDSDKKSNTSGDDPVIEAFEKEKAELEHLRSMDLISTKEYYTRLKALTDKYYTGKEKYIEQYKEQAEELYDLNKDIYDDERENIDTQIDILSKQTDTIDKRMDLLKEKQNSYHLQANELRELGVSDDTDIIKELQQGYRDTNDEIIDLLSESLDEIEENGDNIRNYAKVTGEWTEKQEVELSKQLLDQIDANFEKYKDLYNSNKTAFNNWLEVKLDALENYKDALQEAAEAEIEEIEQINEELETLGLLTNEKVKQSAEEKIKIITEAAKQGAYTEEEYAEKRLEIEQEYIDALKDEYQAFIDYQVEKIQEQIDALENQKDADNEMYEEKINNIQSIIDAMDEEEEKENKLLDLEEKREALAKAREQKTVQIYHEGIGFVWESDPEELKNAQDDYNESLKEYNKWLKQEELQDQIDALEEAKEQNEKNIDDQIEKLEELQNKWSDSIDEIENKADDYRDILEQFADNENQSFEDRMNNVTYFTDFMKNEINEIGNAYQSLDNQIFGNKSKTWYVNKNGEAPTNAQIGDKIVTTDGTYQIVEPNTEGANYNPATGRWSKKINSISTNISDTQWGQEILSKIFNNNNEAIEENTKSYNINSNNILDNIENTKNNTNSINNLSDIQSDNIDIIDNNINSTDTNTLSEDINTNALNKLSNTIANWKIEIPQNISVSGNMEMSDKDKSLLKELQQQWIDAKNSGASQEVLDAIHEAAEDIRNSYGYSGGIDGSEYITLKNDTDNVIYDESGMKVNTSGGWAYIDKGGVYHVTSNKEDAIEYGTSAIIQHTGNYAGGYAVVDNKEIVAYDDGTQYSSGNKGVIKYTYTDKDTGKQKTTTDKKEAEANAKGSITTTSTEGTKLSNKDPQIDSEIKSLKNATSSTDTNTDSVIELTTSQKDNTNIIGENNDILQESIDSNTKNADKISNAASDLASKLGSSSNRSSGGITKNEGYAWDSYSYTDAEGKEHTVTGHNAKDYAESHAGKSSSVSKNANGTLSSQAGFSIVDEQGEELIIRPPESGRMTYLEKGTGVIPADITRNLWDIGTNPQQFFADQFDKQIQRINGYQYDTSNGSVSLVIGDIYLQGVQNVDGLSQAIVNKLPNQIIKDLFKRN